MLRCLSGASAEAGPGSLIKDGDEVIVYLFQGEMKAATVRQNGVYDCRFGNFKMQEWVGKPFGCKVASVDKRGFLFLLAPTPELWTQVLKHRTQILYAADISLITCFLELRPGFTVLESGTGSGSLTHALARAVAPGGHVHTFEFHAERAHKAQEEFEGHGLAGVVHTLQRDIEKLGFPEELHGSADAVFLDLPGPWKVVESAARCLRPDGMFCAFSPCIEQVQRTCGALSQAGFFNVRTVECLLRQYDVRPTALVSDVLAPTPVNAGQKRKRGGPAAAGEGASPVTSEKLVVKPVEEARGHTGYLTFARRIVEQEEDLEAVLPDPIEPASNELQS